MGIGGKIGAVAEGAGNLTQGVIGGISKSSAIHEYNKINAKSREDAFANLVGDVNYKKNEIAHTKKMMDILVKGSKEDIEDAVRKQIVASKKDTESLVKISKGKMLTAVAVEEAEYQKRKIGFEKQIDELKKKEAEKVRKEIEKKKKEKEKEIASKYKVSKATKPKTEIEKTGYKFKTTPRKKIVVKVPSVAAADKGIPYWLYVLLGLSGIGIIGSFVYLLAFSGGEKNEL